jgi:uncharacterized membrane protein
MLPDDFSLAHAIATAFLLIAWLGYSPVLSRLARGSLNSQLDIVRLRWIDLATQRDAKPFDAVLLGHIVNSIAFFGSATLLVLAGMITAIASVKDIYQTLSPLPFISKTSVEMFTLDLAFVAFILTLCFFSFTYSLRKLAYMIALLGALPHKSDGHPGHDVLVSATATVLTEALKSYNFGFRGYYYATAALGLFISPLACIVATAIMTAALFYRQLATPTSAAIQRYVQTMRDDDM